MSAGHWRLSVGAVCSVLACLVLGLSAASAMAAEFSLLKTFGPDGTESSVFEGAGGATVDQTRDVVYLLDQVAGTISKFDLEGEPVNFGGSAPYISGNQITGLSIGGSAGERQLAVDSTSGTIYVTANEGLALKAFQENGEPALFASGPGEGTNTIEGFTALKGVAVDPNGFVYASDYGNLGDGKTTIYAGSGAAVTNFEFIQGGQTNLAVASDGTIYICQYLSNVVKFKPSTFPVTSETTYTRATKPFFSGKAYSVAVDPSTEEVYVAQGEKEGDPARITLYDKTGKLLSSFGGPGEDGEVSRPTGVAVESATEKLIVSDFPTGGLSQARLFKRERVKDRPTVELAAVDDVTGDSAVLRARINPNSFASSYQFEYGTASCDEGSCAVVPIEPGDIAAGHDGIIVTVQIEGLDPGSTYYYRVVAQNALGNTVGPEQTFTTQKANLVFQLTDSRVWEMVSPPEKFGGAVFNSKTGVVQASESGDDLAYLTRGSIEVDPAGNRSPEVSSVLASRDSGVWHSVDLTPPHSNATELADYGEYKVFAPDLALAELEPRDDTPLSPWASERTPYLRTMSQPPAFTPLVTSIEPFANVPLGTEFGPVDSSAGGPEVTIQAASKDLTHIVLQSKRAPLTPDAEPGSLYLWSSGYLEPVSQLPEGEGGGTVLAIAGSAQGSMRHAISEDGTRVFWSPTEGYSVAGISLPALYLRDTEMNESVRLDVVQPGASGLGEPSPAFQGASEDGDVVFFTDSQRLTDDSSLEGRDLYRCQIGQFEGGLGCVELTNLSATLPGSSESAHVLDQVTALSNDGQRLYFVARGVLDEEPSGSGMTAVPGQSNLYLWQEGKGLRFVATLSDRDYGVWGGTEAPTPGYESRLTAAAAPSGRYLAFGSERSLTGYENRNAAGELNVEVFVYDAVSDSLHCASCNPSNATAVGEQMLLLGEGRARVIDPGDLWGGRWVAAILPEFSLTQPAPGGRTLYRTRSVLDNGRVFFNAVDGLVSGDSNGNWDVYQYEPTGTGSCTSSPEGAAVARSGDGCVSLISSGVARGDSGFLDASSSGDDVFFLTRERLSVWDEDDALDVYDARVNGVVAVQAPVTECAGTSCRPSAQQQDDPIPGSAVFHGAGNMFQCPKGKRKVKRHGKPHCIRKHRKKKHQKQAGTNRRVHR